MSKFSRIKSVTPDLDFMLSDLPYEEIARLQLLDFQDMAGLKNKKPKTEVSGSRLKL